MKTAALFFPATFPDAIQPGEYVDTDAGTKIACVGCGVVQGVEAHHASGELIWPCGNEACPLSYWIELMAPTAS